MKYWIEETINIIEDIIEDSKYYKDITGDLDRLKHRLIRRKEK